MMMLIELDDDEFWLNGDTCAVVLQVSSIEPFICCLFVITYMYIVQRCGELPLSLFRCNFHIFEQKHSF